MSVAHVVWASIRDWSRTHPLLVSNRYRDSMLTEDRIEILLRGGLGNQLFGFAAGRAISLRRQVPLHLVTRFPAEHIKDDRSFELSELTGGEVSHGPQSVAPRMFRESGFAWDARVEMLSQPVLLDGNFQSAKYFQNAAEQVKMTIRASSSFSTGGAKARKEPFIALQVRRGDYLNLTTREFHGLLPESYFLEGLSKLRELLGPLPAVVYSDDFETAKAIASRLKHSIPHCPAVNETAMETLGSLSVASGFCISNSSFGWWGAYLAESQAAVIAPRPWFANPRVQTHDLLEPSWLTLGFFPEG